MTLHVLYNNFYNLPYGSGVNKSQYMRLQFVIIPTYLVFIANRLLRMFLFYQYSVFIFLSIITANIHIRNNLIKFIDKYNFKL